MLHFGCLNSQNCYCCCHTTFKNPNDKREEKRIFLWNRNFHHLFCASDENETTFLHDWVDKLKGETQFRISSRFVCQNEQCSSEPEWWRRSQPQQEGRQGLGPWGEFLSTWTVKRDVKTLWKLTNEFLDVFPFLHMILLSLLRLRIIRVCKLDLVRRIRPKLSQ